MAANPLSVLDNIKLSNGPDGLRTYYWELYRYNRRKALELLNNSNLKFGTLYILKSQLSESAYRSELNTQNRKTLDLVDELSGDITNHTEMRIRAAAEDKADTLRWIVRTGYTEEGLGDDYGRLLERSAALLTVSFRDSSILPELSELIFSRYKKGALIHDLVWAFFEARNPESLLFIAQKLNSTDKQDVELARKLLYFVPDIRNNDGTAVSVLYGRVLNWLSDNRPYLYYTGESMNLCSTPIYYAISWPSRYFCHPVSVDTGEPLLPFTPEEKDMFQHFSTLPEIQQHQLADFSFMLYRKNIYQWYTWIRLPVAEQLSLATQMIGGLT